MPFFSLISDLILSLPHCHRHIAIYVVQIIDTILGRMCLLRDLYFTLLCVVVSYLYLTSCLNAHNHNTALFIISQDRQTQVLAANAMATSRVFTRETYTPYSQGLIKKYNKKYLLKLVIENDMH